MIKPYKGKGHFQGTTMWYFLFYPLWRLSVVITKLRGKRFTDYYVANWYSDMCFTCIQRQLQKDRYNK